jgi:hypothetical protein
MWPLLYYASATAIKHGTCAVVHEGGHNVSVNKWICTTKFHYNVHKSPMLDHIQSKFSLSTPLPFTFTPVFQVISSLEVSWTKYCYNFLIHVTCPILTILNESTNYKAPHHVIFSHSFPISEKPSTDITRILARQRAEELFLI